MKIKLINVDSIKIPNLALMQLSTWHKSLGDTVAFDIPDPDRVYISCIFKKNAALAKGIATYYEDSEVILGGSGLDLHSTIPEPAQKIKPDYSLFPNMNYSLGFTTRGCIRNCGFCIVPKKEGRLHRWQHISEFHDPQHKHVKLLDNNWYADKDWFFENSNYLIDNKLTVDVTQGMDLRILTEEIAEQLSRLKFENHTLNFAWDNLKDQAKVFDGLGILTNAGIKPHYIQVYVLTGYNTTPEEDIYRVNKLRDAGFLAFVMKYKNTPENKDLARYVNRRELYKSMTYAEYNPHYRRQKK